MVVRGGGGQGSISLNIHILPFHFVSSAAGAAAWKLCCFPPSGTPRGNVRAVQLRRIKRGALADAVAEDMLAQT